jgi:hypothetical protein
MTKCAICNVVIDDSNDTEEHLIPNAIGGHLKVKKFICNSCNKKSGEKWDSKLANQLQQFGALVRVKRDRGSFPKTIFETISGEKITIKTDGKMTPTNPTIDKTDNKFSVVARDTKEAKSILTGLKKKHPEIDIDKALEQASSEKRYLNEPFQITLQIAGSLAGRSIVKSALACVHHAGLDKFECEHAINYIQNEHATPPFGYYYTTDLIINRPLGIPLHCVSIFADKQDRTIKAYVEYFGVYRILLCLSESYSGETLQYTHAINPENGDVINLDVNLNIDKQTIFNSYEYLEYTPENYSEAFKPVIERIQLRSKKSAANEVIDEAIDYAFQKINGEVNLDNVKEFSGAIMEALMPFIKNNSNH